MQKKNKGGDLDWFYHDEKSPENIKYDPNKKKQPTFREKYVNKKRSFFSVQSLFKSVSFWVVVVIAVVAICFLYVPKTYETVASLERLSAPYMVSKTRNDIQKTVGNSQVTFEILSDCTIYGKVTDIQGYSGFSLMNRISPKDIGISWGKLASKDNEAIWSSPGNRNLYFEFSDDIIKEYGGIENLKKQFSNFHLIPSDYRTGRLISAIGEGDHIKIEGYVVRVSANTGIIFNSIDNATSTDSVNGKAIYVNSITWLKENGGK